MPNTENIKQKILLLDAGSFQNLCNTYLYAEGYRNITALGSEPGTKKTTKGTPDTYFVNSEGQYVFVEYTTKKARVVNKIKSDINKCLDKIKNKKFQNEVAEIIYYHTSSNISPEQTLEILNIFNNTKIKFTLIGIDELAESIYLNHKNIARDFLQISWGSDQIQTLSDFINQYDSNRMAAPLDTAFLFREDELVTIDRLYKDTDIIILYGPAGSGKTRLALEYAQVHSRDNDEQVFCIHSNGIPIYEDLQIFMDTKRNYFLLIDDANQLSNLQYIIEYTMNIAGSFYLKILITVRDYALKEVQNKIQQYASSELVKVGKFTDDEIRKMLEDIHGINNPRYIDRIIQISEGNPRIAILAGKVACEKNCLDSINDLSELYDAYYGKLFKDTDFCNNRELFLSAGLVAFLGPLHLDHIDFLLPIFEAYGMRYSGFNDNVHVLHDMEIVDIYSDRIVRFSEQCFSNYLLKYVFFDKRCISLSLLIKVCFSHNKKKVIFSVRTLLEVFKNKALRTYVKSEIEKVWDDLAEEQPECLFEFVKSFFSVRPTETLYILKNKIDNIESISMNASEINIKTNKNYQVVNDDIIELLGCLAVSPELPAALDLFFQYYLKRSDLFMKFYHAATTFYFGITRDSVLSHYEIQILLFEKIKQYSNNWTEEIIVTLFLEIAPVHLKFIYNNHEEGRGGTIAIYSTYLTANTEVKKYRGLIWQYMLELSKIQKYKIRIRDILRSYDMDGDDVDVGLIEFDFPNIVEIMQTTYSSTELQNCLVVDRLIKIFEKKGISIGETFDLYMRNTSLRLYYLLKGVDDDNDEDIDAKQESKKRAIENYVIDCDLLMIKQLIDACSEISECGDSADFEIENGLWIAFNAVHSGKQYFVDMVGYYLSQNTPLNLRPEILINHLFVYISDVEVFSLINLYEYDQKSNWLFTYYHDLPEQYINSRNLDGVYSFLKDLSDKDITYSFGKDIVFLERYSFLKKTIFMEGCSIVFSKISNSPRIVNQYFGTLFTTSCNVPEKLIQQFNSDLNLLGEIYFKMLQVQNNHDLDGIFLKTIYLASSSVLDKFIEYLADEKTIYSHEYNELYQCFFQLENFKVIYDLVVEKMIKTVPSPERNVSLFLEILLLPKNTDKVIVNQDIWIKHYIERFSDNVIKIECLFIAINKLNTDRQFEYLRLFLQNNSSFDIFERILLFQNSVTWVDSVISVYFSQIEFLRRLLPLFRGVDWIKHKRLIEKRIDVLERKIDSVKVEEIMRGDI